MESWRISIRYGWRGIGGSLAHNSIMYFFYTQLRSSDGVGPRQKHSDKTLFSHLPDEDFNKGATPSPHPPTPLSCGSLIFFISFASSGYCVVHVWTRTPYRELWMQWATPGPKHMPKRMPHRMPDRMSEYMPDRMPERLPVRMSEHMYDRMPESMLIYAR